MHNRYALAMANHLITTTHTGDKDGIHRNFAGTINVTV